MENITAENWIWIIGAAVALFLVTTLLKTVLGLAVQYFIFVGLAGFLYTAQRETAIDITNLETASAIATIGALAFAFTLGLMAVLFRNSKFKPVLFPLVGFATTFAAAAMVTQ